MNVSDLRSSKYLRKEDVGAGVLATISAITQENVSREGADSETKVVLHFHELDKPMVLNSTNGNILANITGHDTEIEKNWIGARVVLYNDPTVQYAGKLIGGIRIRAPKPNAKLPAAPAPKAQGLVPGGDNPPVDAYADDMPF